MDRSHADFIRQHTRLVAPPLLPELQLHLTDDIFAVWRALEEAAGTQVAPPFWASAWVGGQALARYLLDHPEAVAGKRVLDFAAGSGVCALAAVRAGAEQVVAVDTDPWSVAAVALNAAANGVEVSCCERDLLDGEPPVADLVLAGDVCYEEAMARRALLWLHRVRAGGIDVLLGDPGRAHFPRSKCERRAEYDVPTGRDLEDSDSKRTGVYSLRATD